MRVDQGLYNTRERTDSIADAYDTFFDFQNQNGWASPGAATLIGIIGPISTFIGGDSAVDSTTREQLFLDSTDPFLQVHLAEELQDASYVLPRTKGTRVSGGILHH